MALDAKFVPTTEVKIGDRLVGGTVTAIRTSKSGKSIWFTMNGHKGEFEWPRESTAARTAVFTETDDDA
jgi:hypothetical protein